MHENFDRKEGVKVSSDKSFGIVFFIVFMALGIWIVLKGQSEGWLFLMGSIILLTIALACPSILRPLNLTWFKFGLILSNVINPLILGVVFFLVVTPMAVTRRLLGKDSLNLKFKPSLESYWVNRNPLGPKQTSMAKQF
jgi:hypothetical protein